MISGYHTHYCPSCEESYACPKVTHCEDPEDHLCPDHFSEKRLKEKN